jgi:hypothetical protein
MDEVDQKLDQKNNLASKFKLSQTSKPNLRVRFPITKVLSPDMIQIVNGKVDEDDKTLYYNVYVNNKTEAEKVQFLIRDALDVLNKHCKWSGFINLKTVQMIKYVE